MFLYALIMLLLEFFEFEKTYLCKIHFGDSRASGYTTQSSSSTVSYHEARVESTIVC